MKKLSLKFMIVLFCGLITWACEDDALDASRPDMAAVDKTTQLQAQSQTTGSKPLKNVKVTGELETGGTFDGMVTITEFSYDESKGLLVSGEIKGITSTADGKPTHVKQTFTDVEATLASGAEAAASALVTAQQEGCQILFLDLGPLFLDVLGLQVDLSEIVLDITAIPGPGNLLGNLLCAVAGLLDPASGLLVLIENLGQLTDLLEQINDLLG